MEQEPTQPPTPEDRDVRDARTWATVAHLSGLVTNFIGPLIIWAVYKDRYPFVDDQAAEALNFQISLAIYAIACTLLFFLVIPLLVLAVLPIVDLIFAVVAAVNTSNGVAHRYPITIRFIR